MSLRATLRSVRRRVPAVAVPAVLLAVLVVSAQAAPGPVVALADAGGDCPGARLAAPADRHRVPGDEAEADESEIGGGADTAARHGKGRKKHRKGGQGKNWRTVNVTSHRA